MENSWNFTSNYSLVTRSREPLLLGWFLDEESLSDNYTPDDLSAIELFDKWLEVVGEAEYLPIHWMEMSTGEAAPFQDDPDHAEDFLSFWTWPTHAVTGAPVRWMSLPVMEKAWRPDQSDTGGFIQEVTGWKPSPLQRTVHLPTLLRGIGRLR